MAGDWIKMRADLITHPKVVRMMSALKADKFRVIGGLHAAWCLFDVHTEDGMMAGYTPEILDNYLGWSGFSQAMIDISWLEFDGESLSAPRFDEHNGRSAKRRAQETTRKKESRKVSAHDADKKRTREEKRREDIKQPPKPPRADALDDGFDEFWKTYPRKVGKAAALKSWKKSKPPVAQVLAALEWQVQSEQWLRDGGQYIPNPATYLNQGRWQDEQLDIPKRPNGKPWYITASGIKEKAEEFKVDTRGLVLAEYKPMVWQAAGITREMVRKAEQDYGTGG